MSKVSDIITTKIKPIYIGGKITGYYISYEDMSGLLKALIEEQGEIEEVNND